MRCAAKQTASKMTGQCSVAWFRLPGIKLAAVEPAGSCRRVRPTVGVVRKMGQMGEEDRFTTQISQGDVAIEPEPDR